ncbi:MAG: glycosyltransferase family 4 protein [Deltaproteobacteria bacterium]|nr:glycosyltransferase family 4 protein [Deltaproteobacteria bacterium]
MLTVLHTESSAGWGGQETRTLNECLGLKRLGDRVIILCRPGSRLSEKAKDAGIEVFTHPLKSSFDISAIRYCLRLIKEQSVDIVNTHSGVDSQLSAIAARLSRKRPVIVRTRHLALPITSKTSYSLLPHKVVTVSSHVRDYLVDEKGVSADKVAAIPTGVDLFRFDPEKTNGTLKKELGLDESALLVGTIAILRKKKGHHLLLEAVPEVLKAVPDVVFVFAGDGPQNENIEKYITRLGVGKNLRLLGLRSDVPSLLKSIDLFVLPTLQEALGTSILEAAAMKKAVVAFRTGGVDEVVVDGITGVLVEPSDTKALAQAIIRLLKDSPLRQRMGQEGRRLVEKNYSNDAMVEAMRSLYMELLRRKKA